MKKLIVCVLCFTATHSFAQFRLGVQGSFSSLNFWQTSGFGGLPTGLQTWAMNGFQAGAVAEYDLGYSGLMLQPALMYAVNGSHLGNTVGFNDPPNETIGFSDTHVKAYSIRLPVNIVYRFDINPKLRFFAGLGPYMALDISGTEKGYYTGNDISSGTYVPFNRPIDNKAHLNNER